MVAVEAELPPFPGDLDHHLPNADLHPDPTHKHIFTPQSAGSHILSLLMKRLCDQTEQKLEGNFCLEAGVCPFGHMGAVTCGFGDAEHNVNLIYLIPLCL